MDSEKGLTATVYEVKVAVEQNSDGSVTICKELVDDILADKETPEFVRRVLTAGESSTRRFGKPIKLHEVVE